MADPLTNLLRYRGLKDLIPKTSNFGIRMAELADQQPGITAFSASVLQDVELAALAIRLKELKEQE